MKHLRMAFLLALFLGAGVASAKVELEEIPLDQVDTTALSARGRKTLALEGMKWRHAQTDHFVIHFEHGIYARKVARMAEFFYTYIAQDLGGAEDFREGRSHIFIFRKPKKWQRFQAAAGLGDMEWAFSFVEGTGMYLQQASGPIQRSSAVLAHEMTHLVLNRFFRISPPRWLNEGLAEWYGEFARAAFKGVGKSRRAPFQKLKNPFPLPALLAAREYPSGDEISAYYATAKFLVAYLRLEWPEESYAAFIRSMLAGEDGMAALGEHYGIASVEALEEGFKRFARYR